jgi:hypothetical protein
VLIKIKIGAMNKNVGKTDKIVRVIIALCIIVLGYVNQSWWGLVGAGILIPAIVASDPLYTLFKINTKKKLNYGY